MKKQYICYKDYVCSFCQKPFRDKRANHANTDLAFCSRKCYGLWLSANGKYNRSERNRDYARYHRYLWGDVGIERRRPEKGRQIGRKYELIARDYILPKEGFSNIIDFSGYSNQFFIDFVATWRGKRVLVDATIKINASVKEKVFVANALGFDLYMIHVAPRDPKSIYFIRYMDEKTSSKVPATVFYDIENSLHINLNKWVDEIKPKFYKDKNGSNL